MVLLQRLTNFLGQRCIRLYISLVANEYARSLLRLHQRLPVPKAQIPQAQVLKAQVLKAQALKAQVPEKYPAPPAISVSSELSCCPSASKPRRLNTGICA